MKAYKGFNKDMTCRGFQYEEGKTYETDTAKLCDSGFHACENPLDCFGYYSPGQSVYHEVEIEDNGERNDDDTKVVGKKITIGAELSVPMLCKLHFEYVTSKCKPAKSRVAGDNESASAGYRGSASAGDSGSASAGECGSASAGNRGSASAGDYGSASAGYRGSASAGNCGSASAGDYGSASAGNCGSASAGDYGSASAGYRGSASAGDYGSASAGNCGSASAGDYGSASAGYRGSAVSRGTSSAGNNGVAVARGNGVKVKGGLGAVLVLCEEEKWSCDIKNYKVEVVDGKKIKEDTFYKLENGEFVECE